MTKGISTLINRPTPSPISDKLHKAREEDLLILQEQIGLHEKVKTVTFCGTFYRAICHGGVICHFRFIKPSDGYEEKKTKLLQILRDVELTELSQ